MLKSWQHILVQIPSVLVHWTRMDNLTYVHDWKQLHNNKLLWGLLVCWQDRQGKVRTVKVIASNDKACVWWQFLNVSLRNLVGVYPPCCNCSHLVPLLLDVGVWLEQVSWAAVAVIILGCRTQGQQAYPWSPRTEAFSKLVTGQLNITMLL